MSQTSKLPKLLPRVKWWKMKLAHSSNTDTEACNPIKKTPYLQCKYLEEQLWIFLLYNLLLYLNGSTNLLDRSLVFYLFIFSLATNKPEVCDVHPTEWSWFITFDLKASPPECCRAPSTHQRSPDVGTDNLVLETGEAWQGRSPERAQNKESDFTDPLSIKHLRSTVPLPSGIPLASKGNVWGIFFPHFWTQGCCRSAAVFIVLCCNILGHNLRMSLKPFCVYPYGNNTTLK